MTADQHIVLACAQDGTYYRLPGSMSWGTAQDEWSYHDDMRRSGRRPNVRYYAVRSANDPDPRWASASTAAPDGIFNTADADQLPFKLSAGQRNQLVREAHRFRREHDYGDGVDPTEVSDHVFTTLLNDEPYCNLTRDYEAIEVSDYAYGIARFVTPASQLSWY
jgi:hypothetical protein